jgi:hypothetical protein
MSAAVEAFLTSEVQEKDFFQAIALIFRQGEHAFVAEMIPTFVWPVSIILLKLLLNRYC